MTDFKENVNKISSSVINAFVNFGVAVYVIGDLLFNDLTASSAQDATPAISPTVTSSAAPTLAKPSNILRNRRPM